MSMQHYFQIIQKWGLSPIHQPAIGISPYGNPFINEDHESRPQRGDSGGTTLAHHAGGPHLIRTLRWGALEGGRSVQEGDGGSGPWPVILALRSGAWMERDGK